jgi:hypothetical protein
MLWESSKMEQRYDAVLGVIRDGFTVTEAAVKFGVSRQAVHLCGSALLVDTRKSSSCPVTRSCVFRLISD